MDSLASCVPHDPPPHRLPAAQRRPEHAPSRADYERALRLLPKAWPTLERDNGLRSDDLAMLMLMLDTPPGWFWHQAVRAAAPGKGKGLAETLGWPRARVLRSTLRLRGRAEGQPVGRGPLLLGVLHTHRSADRLPFGARNVPRTNILQYFVRVEAIFAAAGCTEDDPSDGSFSDPSTGQDPREQKETSPPNPPAKRATCRRGRADDTPPSAAPEILASEDTTPSASPKNSRSALGAAGERGGASSPAPAQAAVNEREHAPSQGGAASAGGEALERIVASWDALAIPEAGGTVSRCRPSERSVIAKRLGELGEEPLRLALVGVGADAWLRTPEGLRRSAVAWVFHGRDSVEHYAERGAALEERARADAEALRAARAAERAADAAYRAAVAEQTRKRLAYRKARLEGMSDDEFAAAWEAGEFDREIAVAHGAPASLALALPVEQQSSRPQDPQHVSIPLARSFARTMRAGASVLDQAADRAEAGATPRWLLEHPDWNDRPTRDP